MRGRISVNLSSYAPDRTRMSRRVLRGFSPTEFADTRRRRGLSVGELARLADVGVSTIHSWESGRSTPQVDLLARVMRILDAPITQVVVIEPANRYPGDWRVIKGLTQPELAAAAKVSTSTLRGIERAEFALTETNATTLAGLLGISVDEYQHCYNRARQRPPGTPV